jgi:hypothetical protein
VHFPGCNAAILAWAGRFSRFFYALATGGLTVAAYFYA